MFDLDHDGEIKPVVTEKYGIEYGGWINIVSTFGFFGQSKFWSKNQNDFLSIWILVQKFQAFDWELAGRN